MSTVGRAERGWVVFRNPCCGPEGKLMGRGGRCRWEVTRATTQVGMGGRVQETKEGIGRRGERSHRAQGWASHAQPQGPMSPSHPRKGPLTPGWARPQ